MIKRGVIRILPILGMYKLINPKHQPQIAGQSYDYQLQVCISRFRHVVVMTVRAYIWLPLTRLVAILVSDIYTHKKEIFNT
jgi:hypothetical protein